MALLHCDFFSDVLGLSTSMTVILPQATTSQIGMTGSLSSDATPVLYLLHGLSDDHTIWTRRTSVERYVAPLGLAVVMPQVHRSFYTDEVHGNRYWTFLTQELPDVVDGFFHLSRRREDTFVAGLSMGGYGALKWALREPERFAAAASFSGAADVAGMQRQTDYLPDLVHQIFGDQPIAGTDNDLFWLLDQVDPVAAPTFSVTCGTEDVLLRSNRRLVRSMIDRGLRLEYEFGPGNHEWGYWDRQILAFLTSLPLQRPT